MVGKNLHISRWIVIEWKLKIKCFKRSPLPAAMNFGVEDHGDTFQEGPLSSESCKAGSLYWCKN